MKLGTYTTWDCPKREGNEELVNWVNKMFGEKVAWLKTNEHDFGYYESIELDYPESVEEGLSVREIEGDDDVEELSDEEYEKLDRLKVWEEQAEKIYKAYCELWLK